MKNLIVLFVLYFSMVFISCNSKKTSLNKNTTDKIAFDPTGYYLIDYSLKIGDYIFDNLSIITKEQQNNDKSVIVDRVFIQLLKPGSDSFKRLEFKDFKITRDRVVLNMTDKELGQVSLTGKFISKNGPINDNVDIKTVVLKAKLKVNNNFEKDLNFAWFAGD